VLRRRDLLGLLPLAGGAALARTAGLAGPANAAAPGSRAARPPLVKPPRLSPGDLVGLVAPASLTFEASSVDLAVEQLEAVGLEVAVGRHARNRYGDLAGTDQERAADLVEAFANPDVRGIFALRGGWGTPRLLPLLDYEVIRRNPKALIGYSDITALLNAIHQETGLVTFHGPNAGTNLRPYTLDHLRRALFSAEPLGTLRNPEKDDDELVNRDYRIVTLSPGRATGRLVGGNLTLLAATMGTPWEVDTEGAILLLEDIDEAHYRVDRMLTQLALGGKLAAAAGVVFGYCTDCGPGEGPAFSLEELLHHHLGKLGVPAMAGLAFGHTEKMLTLPIGVPATLDAEAGTLTIDEPAVR
jgi:muramoyltetrapeptide carboxypeptidase